MSTTAVVAWHTHVIVKVITPFILTGMWAMCLRKKALLRTGVRRYASGEQWEGRIVCMRKLLTILNIMVAKNEDWNTKFV